LRLENTDILIEGMKNDNAEELRRIELFVKTRSELGKSEKRVLMILIEHGYVLTYIAKEIRCT